MNTGNYSTEIWERAYENCVGKLISKGSEKVGPCPLCGGHDRFHIKKGSDAATLVGCRGGLDGQGCSFSEISDYLFGSSNGKRTIKQKTSIRKKKVTTQMWESSCKPEKKLRHYKLGNPSNSWEIKSNDGKLFAVHARFDIDNGGKDFRWWRNGKWNLNGYPVSMSPLYGSEKIESFDKASRLWIVEGEKCSDVLSSLGEQSLATVTGRSTTHGKESWDSILQFEDVVFWPDHDGDGGGIKHMKNSRDKLGVGTVIDPSILGIEDNGSDVVDFIRVHGSDAIKKIRIEHKEEPGTQISSIANLSLSIEEHVIRYVLMNPSLVDDITIKVDPSDFQNMFARKALETILSMRWEHGNNFDTNTLCQVLSTDSSNKSLIDWLIKVGNSNLTNNAPIDRYIDLIKDNSLRRLIISSCNLCIAEVTSTGKSPSRIASELSEKVDRFKKRLSPSPMFRRPSEWAREEFNGIEFIKTGISKIDNIMRGGLARGEYTILSGLTGSGKSSLAIELTNRISSSGYGVGWFSMELTEPELRCRIFSNRSGVKYDKIRWGKRADQDESDIRKIESSIKNLEEKNNILINASPFSTFDMIRQGIYELSNMGFVLAVVDYFQLISSPSDSFDDRSMRWSEMEDWSSGFLKLARDCNIHILVLSQMNETHGRYSKNGKDPMPTSGDLRGSRALANPADNVVFVWNATDQLLKRDQRSRRLVFDKCRNGMTGVRPIIFDGSIQKWIDFQGKE